MLNFPNEAERYRSKAAIVGEQISNYEKCIHVKPVNIAQLDAMRLEGKMYTMLADAFQRQSDSWVAC
ncbi:MAG: hypothetical protein ABL931_23405 [Usitatibacteraceae bacterium]